MANQSSEEVDLLNYSEHHQDYGSKDHSCDASGALADEEDPPSDKDSNYPIDILTECELHAWKEHLSWRTVFLKKEHEKHFWVGLKLFLSIAAVVLQTLASQIQDGNFVLGSALIAMPVWFTRRMCSLLASGFLVVIPFTTDFLSEEAAEGITDSALVAEEIKSEVFKSLAGITPYQKRDDDSVKKFNEEINRIISETGGSHEARFGIHPITILSQDEAKGFVNLTGVDLPVDPKIQMPKNGKTTISKTFFCSCLKKESDLNDVITYEGRKDLYMKARVNSLLDDMITFAKKHQREANTWRLIERVLTFGSALIGILLNNSKNESDSGLWATVLTTSAAAVSSYIHAVRLKEDSMIFYETAIRLCDLKRRRNRNAHKENEKDWEQFVNDFEETHSAQIRKWRKAVLRTARGKNPQIDMGVEGEKKQK